MKIFTFRAGRRGRDGPLQAEKGERGQKDAECGLQHGGREEIGDKGKERGEEQGGQGEGQGGPPFHKPLTGVHREGDEGHGDEGDAERGDVAVLDFLPDVSEERVRAAAGRRSN